MSMTIKGGIKFEKGKEIPQKMKDHIKANGINGYKLKYANTKLDNFLRVKEAKKKFKFDRPNKTWVQDV